MFPSRMQPGIWNGIPHSCGFIEFAWQAFGGVGATGMALVRICWELPQIQWSQFQLASRWARHCSRPSPSAVVGSTSGITNLRKEKSYCTRANCSWREEWEHVGGTALQTPRSVQKEGQELLPVPEQRLPCRLGCSCGGAAVPLQPMEFHR